MSNRLIFLDVNVPMYAAGQPHPYREACVWVMTEVARGNLDAAIDTEIIQEVLYRFGTLQRWAMGVAMATDLLTIVPVVYSVNPADMQKTIELFGEYGAQGVMARDLIHVAVMRAHNITEIISTDHHFDLIKGITRHDPQIIYDSRK